MQFFGFRYESVWWSVFAVSFLAALLIETFLPFRNLKSSTLRRWFSNGALLAASSILIRCVYGLSGVALAAGLQGSRHGILNLLALPTATAILIGVAALDLTQYFAHRLLHSSTLWRFHQVHHSENDLDATTGFRFHPAEALITQSAALIAVALLGIPPAAVLAFALLAVLQDIFTHANLAFPRRLDAPLRWLIVTPGMHRTHHSEDIAEQNHNFATIFSLWDRCFRTYLEPPAAALEMRFGLPELANGSALNPAKLLVLPFRRTPAPARKDSESAPAINALS